MKEILIILAIIFIVWYLVWISNRQAEWYMRYNKISTFYQELTIYSATIVGTFYIFLLVNNLLVKLLIVIISLIITSYEFRKVLESIM